MPREAKAIEKAGHGIRLIHVDRLHPNPWNPNVHTENSFASLKESVKNAGFLEENPILARPDDEELEIVAGEHRWKAAKEVGLDEVPVVVKDLSDGEVMRLTVVLNKGRGRIDYFKLSKVLNEDYKPYSRGDKNQTEIGEEFGFDRSRIANILPIYPRLKKCSYTNTFSNTQLETLAYVKNDKLRELLVKRAKERDWSSKTIRKRATRFNNLTDFLSEELDGGEKEEVLDILIGELGKYIFDYDASQLKDEARKIIGKRESSEEKEDSSGQQSEETEEEKRKSTNIEDKDREEELTVAIEDQQLKVSGPVESEELSTEVRFQLQLKGKGAREKALKLVDKAEDGDALAVRKLIEISDGTETLDDAYQEVKEKERAWKAIEKLESGLLRKVLLKKWSSAVVYPVRKVQEKSKTLRKLEDFLDEETRSKEEKEEIIEDLIDDVGQKVLDRSLSSLKEKSKRLITGKTPGINVSSEGNLDYDGGKVRFKNCLEGLNEIEEGSVDCVVTDPSYGISFNGQRYKNVKFSEIESDSDPTVAIEALEKIDRVLDQDSHAYVFTRWDIYPVLARHIPSGLKLSNLLVWDKGKGGHGMGDLSNYAPQYELIMLLEKGNREINGKRSPNVLGFKDIRFTDEEKFHPTQKPRKLIEFLIKKSSEPGELVLDPFLGSGTTAVAAYSLDRNFLGFETDAERWKDPIKTRLVEAMRDEQT